MVESTVPTVGQRIRVLRRRRAPRLSMRALGEALGYTGRSAEQTVWEWETNRRTVSANQVRPIAQALGVPISALYDDDEPDSGRRRMRSGQSIADYVTAELVRGWEELPESERQFIRDVADAAERFRARLLREEGLTARPGAPA